MMPNKWTTWLALHSDLWRENEITRALRIEVQDLDLAVGIYAAFGSGAVVWINSDYLPALGMKPKETLGSMDGIAKLKSFLMTVHGF